MNQPLPAGDVHAFSLIPNSPRVIYTAGPQSNDDLYIGFALVAMPDSYVVRQNHAIIVAAPGVLGNDLQGGAATAVSLTPPTHGTLALNSNGAFTYTPEAAYWGPDSFTYAIREEGEEAHAVTVTVSVAQDWLYLPFMPH